MSLINYGCGWEAVLNINNVFFHKFYLFVKCNMRQKQQFDNLATILAMFIL